MARLLKRQKGANSMKTKSFDLYAHVTNTIVAAIEAGATEFSLPWQRTGIGDVLPLNASTGAAYNGVNILSLWAEAMTRGYSRGLWATYRQWAALGAQVRKGARGACVVFYKEFDAEPDPANDSDDGKRRVARASWVFNAQDVDGYAQPDLPDRPPIDKLVMAEILVEKNQPDIRHGGDQAYYAPKADYIQIPDERLFSAADSARRTEDYYAVLFHELTHWTGASHRLNRDMHKRFGDRTYAMEELVAELGSAFLCGELSITPVPRPDHAGYIAGWLDAMKADKRAIFTAAARASEAARYLGRALKSAR
jgi:antirestriction protein ArdC